MSKMDETGYCIEKKKRNWGELPIEKEWTRAGEKWFDIRAARRAPAKCIVVKNFEHVYNDNSFFEHVYKDNS